MHPNVYNGAIANPSRGEASNNAKQDKGKEKVEEDGEKKELTIEELEAKISKDKMLLKKMKEERSKRDNTTTLDQRKRKTMARAQERVLR
jgi:hypothetical protein